MSATVADGWPAPYGLYSPPAFVPVPSPRRSNKLYKSPLPPTPPVLPPLSFIPDSSHALSLISSSPTSSPSRSLHTTSSHAPPPPLPSRKLTKRRPSMPTIPSGSYAYLVHQPPPVPSSPSSPTSLASAPITSHTPQKSAPVQRTSSLMTIRGFKLRSRKSKPQNDPPSPSRWSSPRWPGRSAASESGHSPLSQEKDWLPPMSITPFHVNIPAPSLPRQPLLNSLTLTPRSSVDHPQNPPWHFDSTPSLEHDPAPLSPLKRPKFTLAPEPSEYDDTHVDSPSSTGPDSPSSDDRPTLLRDGAFPGAPARRWTLAMAMTDEAITDEVLVEELERMRLRRDPGPDQSDDAWDVWDAGAQAGWSRSVEGLAYAVGITDKGWGEEESSRPTINTAARLPHTPSLPSFPPPLPHHPPSSFPSPIANPRSSTTPTAAWQAARRALLTCRELVRTERHYLNSLQALQLGETTTAPPPLMVHYTGELVRVSVALLGRMEANPSAWGVAASFVEAEERVESAFVGWCGVVGGWFEGVEVSADGATTPSKRKASKAKEVSDEDAGGISPLMRTVSTWRRSMPSISNLNVSVGVAPISTLSRKKERDRDKERLMMTTASATTRVTTTSKRKFSVRDLAILPTQRIMRYVLLYRDLLAHTPATSPSRALVERAVEAARRIAQKCDRAQGNAAFLQGQ